MAHLGLRQSVPVSIRHKVCAVGRKCQASRPPTHHEEEAREALRDSFVGRSVKFTAVGRVLQWHTSQGQGADPRRLLVEWDLPPLHRAWLTRGAQLAFSVAPLVLSAGPLPHVGAPRGGQSATQLPSLLTSLTARFEGPVWMSLVHRTKAPSCRGAPVLGPCTDSCYVPWRLSGAKEPVCCCKGIGRRPGRTRPHGGGIVLHMRHYLGPVCR